MKRRLVWGFVGFLLVVSLPSWWIGQHVSVDNGAFNWDLAALFGTAVGTTLLAYATGALALSTSQDVRETAKLAKLGEDDQQYRRSPLMLIENAEISVVTGSAKGAMELLLRNVGQGPMVVGNIGITYSQQMSGTVTLDQVQRVSSFTPGEARRVRIFLEFAQVNSGDPNPADFVLSGAFNDSSGKIHPLHDGQALEDGLGVTVGVAPGANLGALE
jgi:hypothetical protein